MIVVLLCFAVVLIVIANRMDTSLSGPGMSMHDRLDGVFSFYRNGTSSRQYGNVLQSLFTNLPKPQLVSISAKAYYVAPLGSGENTGSVFNEKLEKNSTDIMPIASVTKLVTAVVASQGLNKNTTVYLTPSALATEGDSGHFSKGDELSVQEILYPLLMTSSNDAAEALAEAFGRDAFITEMNAWVQRIGARGTFFEDASGLSPHNVSTARDLHTIMEWIYKNRPDLIEITHTKTYKARRMTWTNPTHFLNLSSYVGGKNGYTDEAGSTNVSVFNISRNGVIVPYAIVLLKTSDRDKDTLTVVKYLESLK